MKLPSTASTGHGLGAGDQRGATVPFSPPALVLLGLLGVVALLAAVFGLQAAAQATVNGLVAGSYLGLGAIGLALVIRFSIQFVAGGQARTLGVDILSAVEFGGVRLGLMQATVLGTGLLTMVLGSA